MQLYQPTITGSLSVSGSIELSGSLTLANGGTISGTASIATNAITASSADNLLVRNTLTAQTLVVQTITSSVSFITGSTKFGSLDANTHQFTGSMFVGGNISTSAVGSSFASPRTLGITNLNTNLAARFEFGSPLNSWQVGFASRMSMQSYWGIEIYGGRQSGTTFGFNTGLSTDASLIVGGTVAANTVLVVAGASSQSGNLQTWVNSSNSVLASISSTGALSGTSATFSGNLNLQGAVTRNINFYDSSNTNINAQIQYDQISSNSGQLFFGTNNAGTFATRLTIANTGAATFSNSFTTSDTPVLFLSPNLGTNQSLYLQLGKNISSTYNSGEFSFKYVGNGSSSNMVSLGFYGDGQKLNVLGNGNVGIGTTPSYRLDVSRGSSGVVLNLDGTNAYDAETGILMSAGRAKISGFLNTGGGTPGTSLRFYTMPDEGSVTERMRISSTGNVGIGTTGNPNTIFQVLSSSNNNTTSVEGQTRLFNTFDGGVATIGFSSNSGGNQDGRAGIAAGKDPISGTTGFLAFSVRKDVSTFTEAMRITSAGKVGIGVTNPETLFDVADSSANTLIAVRNTSTANSTGKNAMYGFVGTDTVGTPKLCGGMQAVPNDVNWVNGLLYWYVRAGDGQALRMSLSSGGAMIISGGLTQNGSPSDINLKENLVKISSPLEKISQINGYTFEWKEGSPARGNISNIVEDAGVVAQEIETILPEIVRTSDDNKVVNYNGLTALLIEAMKELKAEFDAYKATHP